MDHVTTRQHGFMDRTIFVDCFKRSNDDDYWWCYVSYYGLACTIKKLREELSRALVEANKEGNNSNEEGIGSLNELVKEMTSKRQDVKAFAFKTKAMMLLIFQLVFYFFLFGFCYLVIVIVGMYRVTSYLLLQLAGFNGFGSGSTLWMEYDFYSNHILLNEQYNK